MSKQGFKEKMAAVLKEKAGDIKETSTIDSSGAGYGEAAKDLLDTMEAGDHEAFGKHLKNFVKACMADDSED